MTGTVSVARCPAKINLALRVVGRRDDGYHELDTVFQTIDLWDELEIRPAAGLTLECDHPDVPADSTNLVWRAAERLRELVARPALGAGLRLRKSIPPRAGLGGGSSDAAGALRLCRSFWGLDVADSELTPIARELGADVPFFLVGGTARGRGRGDEIEPLPDRAETSLLLGFPPYGVSTAEVFGQFAERLTHPPNVVSLRAPKTHKLPEGNDLPLEGNDLEQVVFDRWPELGRFRDALLDAGALVSLLSGSGSTVYGVFADVGGASRAAGCLRPRFERWTLLETRTVQEAVRLMP